MTTTAHRDCTHPATKTARATCRRNRAAAATSLADSLTDLINSYRDGADLESIAAQCPRDLAAPYYNNSLDAESFIAHLTDARNNLA